MAHNQHLDAEDASAPVVPTPRKPANHDPEAMAQAGGPGAAGEPVFVYGTLQRGHSNHHWLAGASFVGQRQLGGAQLFDLGPFPMAVAVAVDLADGTGTTASSTTESSTTEISATSGGVTATGTAAAADSAIAPIHGELYRVSANGLAQLDLLEGCPRLYGRHWLQLLDGSHAWVYLGRPRQVRHARLLADGRWRGRGRTQA